MATAATIKKNIAKLEAALKSKATPKTLKPKLEAQLVKSKAELSGINKGTKPKTSSTKSTQTALQKLKEMVNKNKKFKNYKGAGVDLEKDADRPALKTGKRTAKKSGNTYYEYRANRIDVKQPSKTARYPKLEKGGYMADGGMIYKMADNMTDAEYEKKFSGLNEKQKKTYESLVRLGDSPKLALATTLLSNEVKWDDNTTRAYTMADGGETKHYKENVREKIDGINEEISSINKYLKNLENENTEDAYKASQNLRDYKSILEAKKLHLEDTLKEKGGYMADGGEANGWKKGVTIKRDSKKEAENNLKLLQEYYGKSGKNFKVEKRDDKYVVTYEFNLTDKMAKGGETLMMGDEEVYIKKSSIGLEDEVCLFYKKDDSILKCISKNQFDKFIEQGKLVPKKEQGGYMAKGGYFAKGGLTEHGLKVGDTIVDNMFWDKSVKVLNSKTGYAVVHLETGERKEMKAMGGEMHRTQE